MLRDGRTADAKIGSDLPDRVPTVPQQSQDLSAGRISNCPEHRVVLLAANCNHLVTNLVTV